MPPLVKAKTHQIQFLVALRLSVR